MVEYSAGGGPLFTKSYPYFFTVGISVVESCNLYVYGCAVVKGGSVAKFPFMKLKPYFLVGESTSGSTLVVVSYN